MAISVLNPRGRGYRFGWTSDTVEIDGRKQLAKCGWTTRTMGARGIIREYRRIQNIMGDAWWTCSIWERGVKIAGGEGLPSVRDVIADYVLEYGRD